MKSNFSVDMGFSKIDYCGPCRFVVYSTLNMVFFLYSVLAAGHCYCSNHGAIFRAVAVDQAVSPYSKLVAEDWLTVEPYCFRHCCLK